MTKKSQPKLALSRVLNAISYRDFSFFDKLTPDELKELNLFTLIRYTSNVKHSDPEIEAIFIERSNEFVNKNYYDLIKQDKKLVWKLYASIGAGIPVRYEYLKSPSKTKTDKFERLLAEIYPEYKLADIQLLSSLMTQDEKKSYVENMGFDKKQQDDYF